MRNVILARVDDRLIHGEVVTAWIPTKRATRIIIIDDEVAADQFNVRVVKALAPEGTKCFVYTVDKAAEKLMVPGVPDERLLLLAILLKKSISAARAFAENVNHLSTMFRSTLTKLSPARKCKKPVAVFIINSCPNKA